MDNNQLITNAEALRLFFNDDVYLVGDISTASNDITQTAQAEAPPAQKQEEAAPQVKATYQETVAVLPKIEEPVATYQRSFDFKYLGKNEKGILILVNDLQNPVSTPRGTELLRKLVLSINLKNADFALLNYSAYTEAKLQHLTAFFKCKLLLSFGVQAVHLGLTEQRLHQLTTHEDIRMIFTHNLHDLETDLAAKKTLWVTLKNL